MCKFLPQYLKIFHIFCSIQPQALVWTESVQKTDPGCSLHSFYLICTWPFSFSVCVQYWMWPTEGSRKQLICSVRLRAKSNDVAFIHSIIYSKASTLETVHFCLCLLLLLLLLFVVRIVSLNMCVSVRVDLELLIRILALCLLHSSAHVATPLIGLVFALCVSSWVAFIIQCQVLHRETNVHMKKEKSQASRTSVVKVPH